MATEAEDLAKACELLLFEKQVALCRVSAILDNPLEVIEIVFDDYKRAVLRFREYKALSKSHTELG